MPLGPDHWRARAEEARALAELMEDSDARWRMLRIAADYEQLAARAVIANCAKAAEEAASDKENARRSGGARRAEGTPE